MACRPLLTALTLAAGARLADAIIPVREMFPAREKLFKRSLFVLCGLARWPIWAFPAPPR